MGKRLYPAYRRIRYIRFLKKIRKARKKGLQYEERQEQIEAARKNKEQERKDKQLAKQKQKLQKKLKKEEKKQIKQTLREKAQRDRALARQSKVQEKLNRKEERSLLKGKLKEQDLLERKAARLRKQKQLEEKRILKSRKKALRSYMFKRRMRKLWHELTHINRHSFSRFYSWAIAMAENKDKTNNFLIISLNSLLLFLLSYLFIYLVSQLATVLVSLSFDYKTILFYFKIYYNIDTGDWTADSVKILFSIMPITGLLLGTVSIIIYSTIRNERSIFKLFFLWGFVHGMVMFFGSLLMGTLLNKDFGWVIAYMYYRDTGKMVFSIISIFALVSIGAIISKSFLVSGNSYFNFIDKSNRKFLLMSQVVIPSIIGTIILMFLKIPNDFYYGTTDEMFFELMKLGTVILVILPVVFTVNSYTEFYFDEEPRVIKLKLIYLLAALLIIVAFRYGLAAGIHFQN
ncbi:MAG: hypothetical protein R2764_25690 [Bacteroidales bacterium]